MVKAIDDSFAKEMAKCQYGEDERNDARAWHDIGWNNALAYAHSPQQAAEMGELQAKLHSAEERLARVYDERNAMAISIARLALAAGYKAGWGTDNDENKKWDKYWRTVVYVQFDGVTPDELDAEHYPMQLSWHMPPDWQTAAQALLPKFDGQWDGSFLGREPAKYVGHVPSVPHLSQVTGVTLALEQMGAAQLVALHADLTERSAKTVGEMVARPGSTFNRMFAPSLAPAESFATMQQFGNQESDKPVAQCTHADQWNCKYCDKTETCEALKDPRNFGKPMVKP